VHAAKAKIHSSVSTSAGWLTTFTLQQSCQFFNILRLHQSSGMRQK
jgi:hypothetical protein